MAEVVAHAHVDFKDDGGVDVDVQGVNYMQLYGAAAVLHEQARMIHAQTALESLMGKAGGIVPFQTMPGGLPSDK